MKIADHVEQLDLEDNQSGETKRIEKLSIPRFFTQKGIHPYDELEWDSRTANITNDTGKTIFELENVQAPKSWSQTAVNIVASKYFHTHNRAGTQETSIKSMIDRVAKTLRQWGEDRSYFESHDDADSFEHELTHLLVHQKASFNSPVWFNMGVEEKPQCSACFINSVDDTMESILDLAKTEGLLFKWGSGTGTNFSSLRSSKEKLSTGGYASGPVSFMRGYDAFAGVIKSGGKTRRAAKMVILNVNHPDIEEYIDIKAHEEQKAWSLIDAGYDGSFGGEAYNSVFFQNSNNSVRVTDDYMNAVVNHAKWHTKAITDGSVVDTLDARELLTKMAKAAHVCGDPGIQFDTTINHWHTCPNSSRINSSNPCSEYMFVDDSACNLASLNLLKFVRDNGEFDIEAYRRAVHLLITAQEIIVDNASYPTDEIAKNSHLFRPLGLGYANLGALLMYYGLAYDSDRGRALAATLTAIMTGQAYLSSAIIASSIKPFSEFKKNREPMLRVMHQHQDALNHIEHDKVDQQLFETAKEVWIDAIELGERYGYRNSQVTVLAPTGTIGFMMDCDTTGIEPDIALVKYKKLVGGGVIKLVNNTISPALRRLGYDPDQIDDMTTHIHENDTIEEAPHLLPEHLSVFDCAFKPMNGKRSIHYMGHVRMMSAVQPFLSGAISKTVNMPADATPEDIAETYIKAWEMGLKSIAIYRDGSKRTQPLNSGKMKKQQPEPETKSTKEIAPPTPTRGIRRRLPDERTAVTHKFSIAGHEGYITVGEYDDGTPGEIFIVMAKEGSFVSGLMDSLATSISIGLQYGVPLSVFVNKFSHTRFEPYGFTNNPKIRMAKSISDYIFRWLGMRYLKKEEIPQPDKELSQFSVIEQEELKKQTGTSNEKSIFMSQADAPPCHACGAIMVRNGSCYKCLNCGETSGCS